MEDCPNSADCRTYAKLSNRYIREFLDMRCAPDMLAMHLWPRNSADKEISEAFGLYQAVRKHLRKRYPFHDPNIRVVCVGDGNTPRAAVTFAFRTHWTAHSVDPRLRETHHRGRRPLRLETHKQRIETCRFGWDNPTIIVACHSHAPLQSAVDSCPNASTLAIVAIPCCVEQVLDKPPDIVYDDSAIMSGKRTVMVWENVR